MSIYHVNLFTRHLIIIKTFTFFFTLYKKMSIPTKIQQPETERKSEKSSDEIDFMMTIKMERK